jgi:ectoine hydroxylase-related dioxygenase (phytanoyl-CoA dioxygenase family)
MNLTPELLELLPSDADVAFYQEHGWYISKPIFSEEEIDDAIYGSERHYAGERDNPLLISGYLDWKPEHGNVLRLNDYVSLQNEELRNVVFNSLIGVIAARLSGSSTIRLFHDQLLYKPPQDNAQKGIIGWHVDAAYWATCTSRKMLTAWIPFQDCDENMGTLTIIDGSHKWAGNMDLRTFRNQDLEELEHSFDTNGAPIVKVPMNLKKGQVSFHHCAAIHGGQANLSDRPRIALAVHMQDDSNSYQVYKDKEGKQAFHILDTLCRKLPAGTPDYKDPDICPIMWTDATG